MGRERLTGSIRDVMRERQALRRQAALIHDHGYSFSGYERDFLAWNINGHTFLDISGVSGADSITDGRAAVYADFDNDGDLDIFLRASIGQGHILYRNEIGQLNISLRITLEGRESGRDAYGAIVRVGLPSGIVTRLKSGGSGYLSQSDPRILVGLGSDPQIDWVEVTWPSGRVDHISPIRRRCRHLYIVEGTGTAKVIAGATAE